MSRPTTLTPEVSRLICEATRAGNTRLHSAQYAGVSHGCLRNWIRKGNRGEEPYAAFVADLKKEEAAAVVRNVAIIQTAAKDTWQAAAWWLERRHHEHFSRDAVIIKRLEKQVADLERMLSERAEVCH